jgi:GWxTD domain-containing protein
MKRYAALLALTLLLTAQAKWRDWIKSPEAYFATTEERAEWDRIVSPGDAERFIDDFWKKRGDTFRKEVHSRIAVADDLFRIPGARGSTTARGRVWMILGSPTRTQLVRSNTVEAQLPAALKNVLQNNSVEQAAVASTRWIYRTDKLPVEIALPMPELVIDFQTNTSRGYEVIENPGLVEPYLKRVVAHYASRVALPAIERGVANASEDPLWRAPENLTKAFFQSDAYVAANETPFYAVSFYVPRGAEEFSKIESVLAVGLVRSESGQQVAALRQQMPLRAYGTNGDRFVDFALPLPAGRYSGTFALFNPDGTSLLANRRMTFDVPAASASRISTLLPTALIENGDKQLPYEPFTFVATKYAVKGDHRFSVNDRVGFFTVVANPAGEPQPTFMMRVRIVRDGKVLHDTAPEPASLTQTGPHTWLIGPLFDPGTFPPGRYEIELQLTDAGMKSYNARTDFRVE